jgi:hypothetical protein
MRTTVSINDELLAAAKRRARERNQTLGDVVDAALQRELAAGSDASDVPAVPTFRGGSGPRAGIDLNSNRDLTEALDEGVPLERRR